MLKWMVFGVMWVAGLFVGDVLSPICSMCTGSRLVFFGGMWMLACLGAKGGVEGYQLAKERHRAAAQKGGAK